MDRGGTSHHAVPSTPRTSMHNLDHRIIGDTFSKAGPLAAIIFFTPESPLIWPLSAALAAIPASPSWRRQPTTSTTAVMMSHHHILARVAYTHPAQHDTTRTACA
jgi:hypothetical protein